MGVRIGMIGVGKWARTVHLPNVAATDGAQVVALCSRSAENREAGAGLCAEPPLLFGSAADLLACDAVDAVIVATPNDLHAPMATQALGAGKHVLCEKPMGLSAREARGVAAAARESGCVYAVGLELRCSDVAKAAAQAVQAGRIGAPLMVTGSFHRGWGPFGSGWRAEDERSGGLYAELFCHTADLQSALVGEAPTRVYARAPQPACTAVTFDYPSGAAGVASICLHAAGAANEHPFEIVGEEGCLVGAVVAGTLTLHERGGAEPVDLSPAREPGVEIHGFPGSLEMVRAFVDCIEGRAAQPAAGAAEGLVACRVAEAVQESVETGRPVDLSIHERSHPSRS